jgi:molecular chaperone GrpE
MTKKKKIHDIDMEKKDIDDVVEYEDIKSQAGTDSNKNSQAPSEESEEGEMTSDSMKTDGESKAESAKEVAIKESMEKLAEMQDRYLRLSAEFDNYRKRTLREKMELTKHAGENMLISIIPVMDDFERALKLMESTTDCVAMKTGIDLIYTKLGEFLKQNGLKEIESLNKEFNVDIHDAVSKIPVQDESMKGKVVDVLVKGYWLHDKVMRHSKVVVGE